MFSLTQKSLVKRRLRFQDRSLAQATLFPMFSSDGKVETLLVVDHPRAKVYALPWSKGLVTKSWFGTIRLARKLANLEELTVERAYHLTRFWHYDPWWVLLEGAFPAQRTTPPLRDTNCVDHWAGLHALYFTRDLGRVDYLAEPLGDGVAIKKLKERPLPPREELEAPLELDAGEGRRSGGWRLRTFWQRPA